MNQATKQAFSVNLTRDVCHEATREAISQFVAGGGTIPFNTVGCLIYEALQQRLQEVYFSEFGCYPPLDECFDLQTLALELCDNACAAIDKRLDAIGRRAPQRKTTVNALLREGRALREAEEIEDAIQACTFDRPAFAHAAPLMAQ